MTSDVPVILRPGYVTADMIRDVLGDVSFDPTVLAHSTVQGRPKAPGMKYRHYAPKAELTIFEGDNDRVVEKINELAGENERKGLKVGILSSTFPPFYFRFFPTRSSSAFRSACAVPKKLPSAP